MEKKTRGGSRPGAGRPNKLGETTTLNIRVPVEDLEAIKAAGVDNLSQFYIEAGKKALKRIKKPL